jgi:hypothetical protein
VVGGGGTGGEYPESEDGYYHVEEGGDYDGYLGGGGDMGAGGGDLVGGGDMGGRVSGAESNERRATGEGGGGGEGGEARSEGSWYWGGILGFWEGEREGCVGGREPLQGRALIFWAITVLPNLVLVGALVSLSGLVANTLGLIWITQDFPIQDERAGTEEQKMKPLLIAMASLNPRPSTSLSSRDGILRIHFMRVRVFREMERIAYDPARLSLLFDSSPGNYWQEVLTKHLAVLAPLEMELREIVGKSEVQAEAARKVTARKALHLPGLDLVIEWLAPLFGDRSGCGRQSSLSAQLTAVMMSTDMHVACLHSLAAILEQSQKEVRVTVPRYVRVDDRGVCSGVLGPGNA